VPGGPGGCPDPVELRLAVGLDLAPAHLATAGEFVGYRSRLQPGPPAAGRRPLPGPHGSRPPGRLPSTAAPAQG
jgi:hypothetical protein